MANNDELLFKEIENSFCGYMIPNAIRRLSDGHIICVARLAFTFALHLGVNKQDPYLYRFCFPSLQDAMKAFEEVESVYDVPTFGWVAARPEKRILLLPELIQYTRKVESFPTIDAAITSGSYSAPTFEMWVEREKIILDKGAQAFFEYLKGMK